ncbi:MFS transporter, partial [Rhizobium johnstonii]
SLGGFLIRDFGWRSVFFVVIPIALIAAAAARFFVPESADRQGRSFDMPGQLLGIASLTVLTLTAIESLHLPPLWTALLAIAGALLLLLFIIVE